MGRDSARDTRTATSGRRRTWSGYGQLIRAEKSAFGRFLHDLTYVFTDVSVSILPLLLLVVGRPAARFYGVRATMLVAWATTVVVAAAIRGGLLRPPGTDALGWVSLSPALVVLRVVYFNLALGGAAFGGVAVADALGTPVAALALSFVVALVATLAFPAAADALYRRLAD